VLSSFDGSEWRPTPLSRLPLIPGQAAARIDLRPTGAVVPYEMTLEPQRLTNLPLLEATAEAPRIEGVQVFGQADLQWLADRPVTDRLRFRAAAYPSFSYGPVAAWPGLEADRELPPGRNPRTLEWAAALRRNPAYAEAGAGMLADAVLRHIRSAGFSYTLAPGSYGDQPGSDAIDEFWLDRREGFCEHFAAAFVVVMRALDVPARVVTGYQGTDPAPLDGYYIVRQSSAHAWAEYWQAGTGWVRADPTAAIAPDRIDRGRRLVPPQGLVAGALASVSPALLAQLRDGWDAVNNRWNQWVLNYSRSQQFDVMKQLGFTSPSWEDLALLLIGACSSLAVAGAAWAWWDRHRIDPWTRQREHLRRALRALGLSTATHDTARTLSHRVQSRFGVRGEALAALLLVLERQRFSRDALTRPDAALTRELIARARELQAGTRR